MVHGLDGVDHHQVGLFRADVFRHQLGVGLGEDEEVGALHPQAAGPQLDLPCALLAGDVEHPQSLAQVLADLQEDGGLADARVAADEHQGALDDAAPQHPVQLGEAGVVPLLVGGADLVDGHGVGDDPRGPGPGAPLGQGGLLYRFLHGVPLPAAGALPQPFGGLEPALTALIDDLALPWHRLSPSLGVDFFFYIIAYTQPFAKLSFAGVSFK